MSSTKLAQQLRKKREMTVARLTLFFNIDQLLAVLADCRQQRASGIATSGTYVRTIDEQVTPNTRRQPYFRTVNKHGELSVETALKNAGVRHDIPHDIGIPKHQHLYFNLHLKGLR